MTDLDQTQVRARLLQLLSRREYSKAELRRKMYEWQVEPAEMDQQLDRLETESLQSDTRFAEMLVRTKANRGYGPLFIKQSAQLHQLSSALLGELLASEELDWYALARRCYEKKYGETVPTDLKEKQKRMAYLQRHGFMTDHIREALIQQN
jgi:regulatory protein